MPRNGTGTYTLPSAPFSPGTTISSAAVNSDLSDVATALTASIAADGQTPITAPLKLPSGSIGAPSLTFTTDTTTGVYYPGSGQLGFAAGGVSVAKFSNTLPFATLANGAVLNPVGIIQDFAGSTAPTGWLLCYGQSLSAAAYPELFAVIDTTYGGGGGNFNLPDCRGRTSTGVDNMGGTPANRLTGAVLGTAGGVNNGSVTLTQGNLPNVNFTNSGITLNDPGHTHPPPGGNNYMLTGSFQSGTSGGVTYGNTTAATGNATTGITISNQGHAASGGSGTAISTLNPGIAFNKIIFAGRP